MKCRARRIPRPVLFSKANCYTIVMAQKEKGLTRSLVERMSRERGEPAWMREKRLHSYTCFERLHPPSWGPSLEGLDLAHLTYYVPPDVAETTTWSELPEEIMRTFDALGIPEAERAYLGGVGAQYDSGVVYHKLRDDLVRMGVVFESMDTALTTHPALIREHFMDRCVPVDDHYFAAMHGAVWSGGTFLYVPKGVRVAEPLQAYFRMNRAASGQFEHTLIIVDEGAEVTYIEGCSAPRYSASSLHAGCVELFVGVGAKLTYISIENWSSNTYNLNTKRALVEAKGEVRWVGGNMGSGVTMLYPSSVLIGEGARSDNLGIVFAGKGQVQDTGAKAIHLAPHTVSTIRSKSISKEGGVATYRGLIKVSRAAKGATASLVCDSLLLDGESAANAFPAVMSAQDEVTVSHEATIGRLGDEELFYLMSRGLARDDAVRMIVGGFVDPIVRALPLEYAVEFNKLIDLEVSGHRTA